MQKKNHGQKHNHAEKPIKENSSGSKNTKGTPVPKTVEGILVITARGSGVVRSKEIEKSIEINLQQSTSSCNYERNLRDCWWRGSVERISKITYI